MFGIDTGIFLLLGLCLLLVCAFEFINGFHDTANAVAPVIYTNSLSAKKAVLLAAIFNFLGVVLGGIAVAMGIIHLLPLDIIASEPVAFGICVVLSLLISAIIWNLGTWYLGIPASSSHTLIGSILGVSLAMYYLDARVVLPIGKVTEVFESLLISPFIGFLLAFWFMHILHLYIKGHSFFKHPDRHWNKHPKTWIRGSLIGSSALVSFAHGSNDGQKGVGLTMLILISLAPSYFAMNPDIDIPTIQTNINIVQSRFEGLDISSVSANDAEIIRETKEHVQALQNLLAKWTIPIEDRINMRKHILKIQKDYKSLSGKSFTLIPTARAATEVRSIDDLAPNIEAISSVTDYAPWWVIAMISLSLGLWTMIGWKRIVVTIGEKIGKEKLSYAQWTVASIMTAVTISSASQLGLPVSTTHIMSSWVAGTAAHEYGKHGLQGDTIKSILTAWVLTLPVSAILAGVIFMVLRFLFVG
jgi:phosphate/sulfate permease